MQRAGEIMKIILKYMFNSVRERKLRTLVMLLSVTLSATLLFVSLGIGASYERAQRKMAIGYAGAASIMVTQRQSNEETVWITKEELPELSMIQHIAGILCAKGLYAENGYYETIDILSADLADLDAVNAPRIQEGRLSDFTGYKIALPDRFSSKYGVRAGDTVSLKIDGECYKFEVAAICAYDTVFLRHTRGYNALIPFETMSAMLSSGGAYSEILIVPGEGTDARTLSAELSERMDTGVYRVSSVYNEASVAADTRQKSMPFYLISFFTLTISSFIIYSSYKIMLSERLPVIGTFRSIGAAEKTVKNLFMGESLVYGVSGSMLSIPAGCLTLKLILYGMSDTASYGIEIPMVVSVPNIVLSCSIAIIISVSGAYIPIKRASKLPIKDVVLGTVEERNLSDTKTLMFGLALFIVSVILPRITSGKMLILAGGASLLTLIVSAIIIIPLFIAAISHILEPAYGVLFGNVGRLAARNLRGNKNTNQNAVLLFISISAIIVISVVGNFVNTYIGDVFRDAALDGFSDAAVDAAFIADVRELDTVTKVLPIYVLDHLVQVNGQSFRAEAIDNISLYNNMLAIKYTDGEQRQVENSFDTGRNVILNSSAIDTLGVEIGDTVTLSGAYGSFGYTVIGSFKSRASDVNIVLPSACAVRDFRTAEYGFFVYEAGDPEAVMTQIRDLLGEQEHWSHTVEEYTNDARETVNTFLSPMNKLTYFILLLATVGVINNLLINYIQKRRSIAMYKSVGLSNIQNIQMTVIESFSVGLIGALMGTVVSWLEIKTVFLVAGPQIAMEPELKISTFLYAALLGIAAVLIGSLVPIIKGAKMRLVEEIKFE